MTLTINDAVQRAAANLKMRSPGGWGNEQPSRSTEAFLSTLHGAVLESIIETGSFNTKQLGAGSRGVRSVTTGSLNWSSSALSSTVLTIPAQLRLTPPFSTISALPRRPKARWGAPRRTRDAEKHHQAHAGFLLHTLYGVQDSKTGKLYARICNRVVAIKPGTALARDCEKLLDS